jgi:hypothetical protein
VSSTHRLLRPGDPACRSKVAEKCALGVCPSRNGLRSWRRPAPNLFKRSIGSSPRCQNRTGAGSYVHYPSRCLAHPLELASLVVDGKAVSKDRRGKAALRAMRRKIERATSISLTPGRLDRKSKARQVFGLPCSAPGFGPLSSHLPKLGSSRDTRVIIWAHNARRRRWPQEP